MPEQNIVPENLNNSPASTAPAVPPSSAIPPPGVSAPNVTETKTSQSSYPKKDLIIAGVIGLLCALLILPIAENLAIKSLYAYALIIILPLLSIMGMWLAGYLAQKLHFIYQLAKFILVGLLNTFVDWGILNLLMFLTSATSGYLYMIFKGFSFLAATSNSYAWNKFWTFKKSSDDHPSAEKKAAGKEFLQFFVVSLIGFSLNVGVATLVVNVLGPQMGVSAQLWANIGALGGTLAGLTWNFLGYKLIVFKD